MRKDRRLYRKLLKSSSSYYESFLFASAMAPIKIKHVVSFTSQDPENRVDSLCGTTADSRPWLCSPSDRSGVLKAELQLERVSTIAYIDVGNFGSSFVQVDVGRSSWPLDHPYVTLLPTAALMNPADARQGTGKHGVRMFKKEDFLPKGAEESWDRLRITCSQPFNKRCQFGLSFLRLRSAEQHTEEASGPLEDMATDSQSIPDKIQSVREWLSSPAVQHIFGPEIRTDSPRKAQRNHGSLSRAERMLTAAQSVRRSCPMTPPNTLTSHPLKDKMKFQNTQLVAQSSGFLTPRSKTRTAQDHRRSEKRHKEASISTPKKIRSSVSQNPEHNTSKASTLTRTGSMNEIKRLKHSPVKTCITATPPTQSRTHGSECPETICPICGVSFSSDYLPLHASSCLDSSPAGFEGGTETEVMATLTSSPTFSNSRDELTVPCPVCSFRFSTYCIQEHASSCGDTVWVD